MRNTWSQEKYLEAYRFAAEKHTNEFKNSEEPQLFPGTNWSYVVHLSMVSMEIMAALNYESDINGDLAIQAAILHDTIEDTNTTYEELQSNFGQKVADGVLSLSKDKSVEKTGRMVDSLRRIKLQPKEIWMVKLSDRISNLQKPLSHWNNEKRKKYLEEARMIYDELKDASEYLSGRLKDKIQNYQTHMSISEERAFELAGASKKTASEPKPTETKKLKSIRDRIHKALESSREKMFLPKK